nr:LYR motif-containing protein At3g19508 [Ipomoea batatas]
MKKALMAYKEVLRLVKRLPEDTRPYYAKYVRENFVNYREIDANDSVSLHELLLRTYNHSIWILKKTREISFIVSMEDLGRTEVGTRCSWARKTQHRKEAKMSVNMIQYYGN